MHNVVSDVVDGEQERVLYRSSLLNARALIFTRAYLCKKSYVIKRPTRKLLFQAISTVVPLEMKLLKMNNL